MVLPHGRRRRRGSTLVQFAFVAPVALMFLFGLLVGGMGVFRYQQLAHLTREATRYAAVHGADYASDTGNPAATAATIYSQSIVPNAVGLNLANLSYSVVWNTSNSPYSTTTSNGTSVNTTNTVTVTINYAWIPEAYFGGVTFTSKSSAVMSY